MPGIEFDDRTLVRYRFAEMKRAERREGYRCWMCRSPLSGPFDGRAHIIANNKPNKKKYGSWVLDHRDNFRMSCQHCNSYATKYKPDPEGEYVFDVIVGHGEDMRPIHGKSVKLSILTINDMESIISSIKSDLVRRGINKDKPERVHGKREVASDLTPEHRARHSEYANSRSKIMSKLKTRAPKNIAEAYEDFKKAHSDFMAVFSGSEYNREKSTASFEKISKDVEEKIQELLSEN